MDSTTVIFEQNNKENTPPLISLRKATKAKCKKKNPIQTKVPSFRSSGSGNKRKAKRIPLADITNLFNNASSTFTCQVSNSVSAIPSLQISISRVSWPNDREAEQDLFIEIRLLSINGKDSEAHNHHDHHPFVHKKVDSRSLLHKLGIDIQKNVHIGVDDIIPGGGDRSAPGGPDPQHNH
ncbi:unnamed protein product [Lupinus luteus]|uniref:Uncharacterized protein n=1 Tax=Lupinus luteus TaxID=3873 RepID=A0AAV1YIH1_LUPLU